MTLVPGGRGHLAQVRPGLGRGPFDDTVAAMLKQLLAQRGVAARSVLHAAVSQASAAELADPAHVLTGWLAEAADGRRTDGVLAGASWV